MRHRLYRLAALAMACLIAPSLVAQEAAPLVLTPGNTIILDGTKNAGKHLQGALLKCVARTDDADRYMPQIRRKGVPFKRISVDRTASKAFPLYTTAQRNQVPQGRNIIAIGWTHYLTKADRERLKANIGAMIMRRQGNVIVVAGDTPHDPWKGEMATMSVFLNRVCGVRFYAPDPLWWTGPKKPEIVVEELDEFIKPALAKATWSGAWYPNYPFLWERFNKPLSKGYEMRGNHAIISYFKPGKYYAEYPQIYEMKGKVRPRPKGKAWNPCLSAKELPTLAMEEVRLRMASKRRPTYLAFGVMDCAFDCHCGPCQASVKQHDGSYSNLYYTFLNQVARACQKEFPDLYLTTYIYSNVRRPPVGINIEPNIVTDYVSKTYEWVTPAYAAHEAAAIRTWSDLGASWVIHDWSFAGITPRAYTRQFAWFLQWGIRNGMKGLYVEWSHYDAWHLEGARYWIMRQLETNPYQDVDALWRLYCDDMYGAGSEYMYRLFQHFADRHTYADKYVDQRDWPKREFALYTEDDLVYQRALIARARAATRGDATIRKRFEEFMPWFRQHELWVQAVGEPSRLAHQHQGEGVNTKALAYYLNDDGSKLREAITFYKNMRADADPLTKTVNQKFELLPDYAYNYSWGIGQIVRPIKLQALAQVDLAKSTPKTPGQIVAISRKLLRKHLPKKYRRDSLQRIEGMLEKAIWVPRATTMPRLDGRLADAVWRNATVLKDCTVRAVLLPSKHMTTGKIMRVGDKLVVGIRCDQVGPIWASTPKEIATGTRIWRESSVEFMLGKVGAKQVGRKLPIAQYIINAFGSWRGFQMAKGNRDGMEVAVHLDKAGGYYVIEAAIPLKTKGYDFTTEKVLSFNLMRNVFTSDSYREDAIIGWAPIFHTARNPDSRGLIFLEH